VWSSDRHIIVHRNEGRRADELVAARLELVKKIDMGALVVFASGSSNGWEAALK
jgi:hypothetical protein